MNYRPSADFAFRSNRKAQKKAGTWVDPIAFYARQAQKARQEKCVNCGAHMTGIYAICRDCRKVQRILKGGESI